jgi:hypothetical protein
MKIILHERVIAEAITVPAEGYLKLENIGTFTGIEIRGGMIKLYGHPPGEAPHVKKGGVNAKPAGRRPEVPARPAPTSKAEAP